MAFDVSTTVNTSPLAKVVLLNVLLFVPALVPFTFHWYEGVPPPFVGVAVNVTFTPAHIVVELAAAVTLTGKFGFTVIVIPVLVAGLPVAQVAFEISTIVTTSP